MKLVCLIVALFAWCGAMWVNVRAIKQARAAGYGLWSLDPKAQYAAWRGKNLPLFLGFCAIFASAILTVLLAK